MSRLARSLAPSLRSLGIARSCCASRRARTILNDVRTYAQSAVLEKEEPEQHFRSRPTLSDDAGFNEEQLGHTPSRYRTQAERLAEVERLTNSFELHLKNLFPELRFPPDLAQRLLTHGSHVLAAAKGHNAAHSFIGRRVMNAYLQLFLNSSSSLAPQDDTEEIASKTLNTYLLGEVVGTRWGVARAMVWEPSTPLKNLDNLELDPMAFRGTGLFKTSGIAVEAIVGGVYSHWGASVAQRFFHTRVLPLLMVHGGLPKSFHNDALSLSARYGGSDGTILQDS